MAGRIEAGFGRLDTLVNKAGNTIKTPPADLDGLALPLGSGFAVCVRGLFRVTRASVPLLRAAHQPTRW
jgi:NAD(P)-dependent dehydrogenase (short-subunit alcohol dehydrogenase family)